MTAQLLEADKNSSRSALPSKMECRVWERHGCGLDVSCQPVAARGDRDLAWPAEIRNVSVGGVGLVLGRRFERGAGLAIEIPETPAAPADTLLARVIHATALPGGEWLLGCSFISNLSDDEVQRLLELAKCLRTRVEKLDTDVETQRVAVLSVNGQAVPVEDVIWEGVLGGRAGQRRVRRLHLKGSWPLLPGTVLRVWFGKSPRISVRLQVTSCGLEEGRWLVKYAFLDPPPAALLHSLGF